MSDHMVVYVDGLMRPVPLPPVLAEVENLRSETPEPSGLTAADNAIDIYDGDTTDEDSLIWSAECRICQEESSIKKLESPCACNGSLKYAHRKCVQRWCNEKGNTICEICHQPYQAGYTSPSPPPPPHSEDTTIDIGGGWTISGLDLHDPRLMAIAEAERQILESEYDDYTSSDTSGAAFFRSAALIMMTLLLLRHALTIPDYADDDPSSIFSLFLLRAASFLLPCYIMASAISILHRRRQRQEAAALATRFALVLSSRQPRAVINYLSMEP